MNYYGTGRSNYVMVTNIEEWKKLCEKYNLGFLKDRNSDAVGFHSENEDGYPTTSDYNEETEEEIEYPNFLEAFSELLLDDQVLIWMQIGNEGMRYLNGHSIAINNKKQTVEINIDHIYKKSKKLGKNITECSF